MSLGGKTTQSNKIDPDLKKAALENLAMAKKIGQVGYVPYTGDTVAGMQPGQIAAIQSGNMGANAFGLSEMAVPTGANLNPYAAYQAALAAMPAGQRAFIESMFINPQTGAAPTMSYGSSTSQPRPQTNMSGFGGGGGGGGGGDRDPYNSLATPASYAPGGVNTNNPNSIVNQIAAVLRGGNAPQANPTAANRPVARP
jgi:hypothetical protein